MKSKEALTKKEAICWCVENLSRWPSMPFGFNTPSPNGWYWTYETRFGLHLSDGRGARVDAKGFLSAMPSPLTQEEFTGVTPAEFGAISDTFKNADAPTPNKSEVVSNENLAQKTVIEGLESRLKKAENFIRSLAKMSRLERVKVTACEDHQGPILVQSFYEGQEIVTANLFKCEIKPIGVTNEK